MENENAGNCLNEKPLIAKGHFLNLKPGHGSNIFSIFLFEILNFYIK